MEAGDLDRMIELRRQALNVTAGGDPGETFDPYDTVYAKVEPLFGTERWAGTADVRLAEADIAFTIRFRASPVVVTDRIAYDGREYDIISIVEIGRREGWRITGRARTGQA